MTIVSVAATAMLAVVGAGDVVLGIALFAIAHLAHLLATSLYNSYLPLIAAPDRLARISGLAWRISYLGSVARYLLSVPFTRGGLAPENVRIFTGAFVVSALFLGLIGLPASWGFHAARRFVCDPRGPDPVTASWRPSAPGAMIATSPSSSLPTIS